MKVIKINQFIVAFVGVMVCQWAWALSSTTTFQVTAAVVDWCNVTSAPLAFGTYDSMSVSSTDSTSSISVLCNLGVPYDIALNQGISPTGSVSQRYLMSGTNMLEYNLFADSGRNTIWGDGTSGTSVKGGTATGIIQNYTVYGRIPAQQTAIPSGAYVDTITVSVSY